MNPQNTPPRPPDSGKNEPRVVRKYSNRRLYDSRQSKYITLDQLKDLILAGEPLRVVNAGDGADITRQTLVQVLLSEEVFGEPVFSEQSLRNLIMFFRGPLRGPMAVFFDQCAPMFMDAQKRLMDRLGARANPEELNFFAAMQGRMVRELLENYAFRALENYLNAQQRAEQNMERMLNMPMFGMAKYFTPPPFASGDNSAPTTPTPPTPTPPSPSPSAPPVPPTPRKTRKTPAKRTPAKRKKI